MFELDCVAGDEFGTFAQFGLAIAFHKATGDGFLRFGSGLYTADGFEELDELDVFFSLAEGEGGVLLGYHVFCF
jgi:hypothetical protein